MTYQCLARIHDRYGSDRTVSHTLIADNSNQAEFLFDLFFYIHDLDPDEVIIFDVPTNVEVN